MSRLAVSSAVASSATDDRRLARAVELDLVAGDWLVAVELAAHRARDLELAADDADVAPQRAAGADDRGQLVVDRREERRTGVPHQRDHPFGAGVHERQ